ncbi:folate-binding protein YgfZ [Chelativorans sp. Marseille-P2723]|uniref:CAF17-like 4Fe-4S cluster assembly/insertion protein YgfZ n=1 Tax=Chelativorans sp. Marseille-P2723 TaxID=2709133 RepID=UPI00156D4A87|nr:folate-binding protein YgfZ [Chelativorans sp. Marseille-P2723]
MPLVKLPDRSLILAAGSDAETLLQNVITTDLSALAPDEARPGALLTPQGKVLFDFLISRAGDERFWLECRADVADDLRKRLMFYRLRSKVDFLLEEQLHVAVSWEIDSAGLTIDSSVHDRRFPATLNVMRHYHSKAQEAGQDVDAWHRLRIAHGVAESGAEYALGDAFPHDILFDQNGGVGLKKGCYVGQEVVSRMHHRGTARRRLVIAKGEGTLPAPGTEITAGGRSIGALGSVSSMDGLAIVRIDRVAEAMEAGIPVMAGDVALTFRVPEFASFTLTGSSEKSE